MDYLRRFNKNLEMRGNNGNSRYRVFSSIRAIFNLAIDEKLIPKDLYPFGKNGFSIGSFRTATKKRFVGDKQMIALLTTPFDNKRLETSRRLLMAMYYLQGMAYVDAAYLEKSNFIWDGQDKMIKYTRRKVESKGVEIFIPVTPELEQLFEWFRMNTRLVGDHVLPIITEDLTGKPLYKHILNRYRRVREGIKYAISFA